MTVKKSFTRRIVASAGALTLAATGMVAMGSASFADVGPDQPGAPTSGTLTINKYSGAHTDTPAQEDLLDGVEFTVTQVGNNAGGTCAPVDLTEAADWDGLEGLFDSAPAAPADPYCLTDAVQVKSTVDGQAVFDLDLGIYFVEETDSGDNNIVSPVPSFYVSIPTSEGDGGSGWNYDVVADPKNQLMEGPVKTIDDANVDSELVVGADVTWNIDVPVPTLNNDETFTEAVITDVLDSRLELVLGSTSATVGTTALAEGTHYNVSGNAVWTFTPAGLAVLDDNMGETLSISFDTTVLAVGDGIIPNDDYSSKFNGTEVPGEPVPYTYYGNLSILKVDDSLPNALPLEGAEFQVFDTAADGTCAADAPATGSIATGTSDANGVVQWAGMDPSNVLGLWIGNFDEVQLDPTRDYCIYETVVPAGHTATPIDNPVTIHVGDNDANAHTVVNPKTEGPDLPLTGAQGTLMMTIGGLLIIAVGTGAIIIARRRTSNQNI